MSTRLKLSKESVWYKRLEWLDSRFMRFGSLFLLVFIPLYPKIPLLDIWQTWVNIRLEDLLVFFLGLFFVLETTKKRTAWRSPLTIPILIYWAIGGISALHAVFVFVPHDSNMFFHLVALHYFRQIEYMLLFFVVITSIKSMREVRQYIAAFLIAVSLVVVYGFGQEYLGFCAFLTGNEEFAKGECLVHPPRNTATFAGHYDLAAYLVLAIALSGSLFFGMKKWVHRLGYLAISIFSSALLLLTKSRASFFAVIASGILLLIFYKKKWLIVPILLASVVAIVAGSGLRERFGNTLRVEDVVYDVRTNKPIARVPEFKNTKIVQDVLNAAEIKRDMPDTAPTPTPFEELPVGTGFLDVPYVYRDRPPTPLDPKLLYGGEHPNVTALARNYVIKKTLLYDISFTTRSQGQWPRAISKFNQSTLVGSGYSSVGIAVDNNYLRRLAEVGLVGTASYLSLFLIFFLVVRQYTRKEKSAFGRSIMLGLSAGIAGLMVNAVLIDVFDASKVAYTLWMLVGVGVGLFQISRSKKEPLLVDATAVARSNGFAVFLISAITVLLMYPSVKLYFIGDDFTWLRWAVETSPSDTISYIWQSEGFFYRPFTRSLMFFLYQGFGLHPTGYHTVSIGAHIVSSILVFAICRRLTGSYIASLTAGVLFSVHPVHAETILWMSGYSGLFGGLFSFAALYVFIVWNSMKDSDNRIATRMRKLILFTFSLILYIFAMMSYEVASSLFAVIMLYVFLYRKQSNLWKRLAPSLPFVLLFGAYLVVRNTIAGSHPLSGDYNYNMLLFPFNAAGNILGYSAEMLIGQSAVPLYDSLRSILKSHVALAGGIIAGIALVIYIFRPRMKKISLNRNILFSLGWFAAALLPVLGLGNIAERYLYIPSAGFIIAMSILLTMLIKHKNNMVRSVYIAVTVSIVALNIIGFLHASATWKRASTVSENILRSVTVRYLSFAPNTSLYFVNVPIRIERAWVYPIGLSDALWLHYRDDTIRVFRTESVSEALEYKNSNPQTHIFEYTHDTLLEIDPFSLPTQYAEENRYYN